jgi:hypothetical protein
MSITVDVVPSTYDAPATITLDEDPALTILVNARARVEHAHALEHYIAPTWSIDDQPGACCALGGIMLEEGCTQHDGYWFKVGALGKVYRPSEAAQVAIETLDQAARTMYPQIAESPHASNNQAGRSHRLGAAIENVNSAPVLDALAVKHMVLACYDHAIRNRELAVL